MNTNSFLWAMRKAMVRGWIQEAALPVTVLAVLVAMWYAVAH